MVINVEKLLMHLAFWIVILFIMFINLVLTGCQEEEMRASKRAPVVPLEKSYSYNGVMWSGEKGYNALVVVECSPSELSKLRKRISDMISK